MATTVNITSPVGSVGVNLRPGISFDIDSSSLGFGDTINVLIRIKESASTSSSILSVQKTVTLNFFGTASYTFDQLFTSSAASLNPGTTYYYEVKHPTETDPTRISYFSDVQSFSTTQSVTSLTFAKPITGTVDRTPELQAVASNNYGYTVSETQWSMYSGAGTSTLIGITAPGINTGTGASILEYTAGANWVTYTPLSYGGTYTVRLRVVTSDGSISGDAQKTFTVGAYKPVATITSPSASKIDSLTPTINGTFTSSVGLIIAQKTVTSTATDISEAYDNTGGTWSIFTPLSWATAYAVLLEVQDAEGIWSSSTLATTNPGYRTFLTNRYPTPPTNLVPASGSSVRSLQPYLSAKFNDPDVGDTPATMTIEVAGVTDTAFSINRTESDGDTSIRLLLADDLVANDEYIWRVRFTDQGGLVGEWSPWTTFTIEEGIDVNLTNPLSGEILTTPVQTFTWDYTHASAVAQASGRLRIYNETGGVPIYDTGTVLGTYESQVIPPTLFANNKTYRVNVTVADVDGDIASTPDIFFSTLWVGPPQPVDVMATPDNDTATVFLEWDINADEEFVMYRIYKRDPLTETDFTLVDEVYDRMFNSYTYYFAPSGRPYDYALTAVVDEGGAFLESQIVVYVSAQLDYPTDTWLVDEVDPLLYQVKLQYNPARSTAREREQTVLQAIGRRYPVVHYGNSYTETANLSFMIRLPYTELLMVNYLVERGNTILYRDGRGRKMWGAISNVSMNDSSGQRGTLSFTFMTTDSRER
jgi:hypothetical protein